MHSYHEQIIYMKRYVFIVMSVYICIMFNKLQ